MTDDIDVGLELPELVLPITRTSVVRYAGASTDFNPIHHSDHAARALGLDQVVAHGMLTMAMALQVVTRWTGDPGGVQDYFVRFVHPVLVPDDGVGASLRVRGVVSAVDDESVTVTIEAVCDDEKVLGAARARVRRNRG